MLPPAVLLCDSTCCEAVDKALGLVAVDTAADLDVFAHTSSRQVHGAAVG
jgi:hypothetical protein